MKKIIALTVVLAAALGGCMTTEQTKYVDFAAKLRSATKTEGVHSIPGPITGRNWLVTTTRVPGDTVGSLHEWVFVSRIDAPEIEIKQPE